MAAIEDADPDDADPDDAAALEVAAADEAAADVAGAADELGGVLVVPELPPPLVAQEATARAAATSATPRARGRRDMVIPFVSGYGAGTCCSSCLHRWPGVRRRRRADMGGRDRPVPAQSAGAGGDGDRDRVGCAVIPSPPRRASRR